MRNYTKTCQGSVRANHQCVALHPRQRMHHIFVIKLLLSVITGYCYRKPSLGYIIIVWQSWHNIGKTACFINYRLATYTKWTITRYTCYCAYFILHWRLLSISIRRPQCDIRNLNSNICAAEHCKTLRERCSFTGPTCLMNYRMSHLMETTAQPPLQCPKPRAP